MPEYVVVLKDHVTLNEGEELFATFGFTTVRKESNYRILRVVGPEDRIAEIRALPCVEMMEKVT